MTNKKRIIFLQTQLIIILLIIGYTVQAKVVLPSVFTDNMVLQQKTNAAIWGQAKGGAQIIISTTWGSKQYKTTADTAGNWKLAVATPAFGGPYNITISDGDALTLQNVLIGEVWVCSGQSNMEFPVSGWSQVLNYKQELADAQYAGIRLLQVEHVASSVPLNNAKVSNGGWQICTPQNVAEFSAVAYFFARDIYKKTGMPIGLIHASWGGTIIQAWTSAATVKTMPDLADAYNKVISLTPQQSQVVFNKEVDLWQKNIVNKDAGYDKGIPRWSAYGIDETGWKTMALPGMWETNQMPDMDGIVWFRKKMIIPSSWAGKDMLLSLGTIDDNDITYFNGKKIGETNGYEKSRLYTIPASAVKAGEAIIAVRVFDGGGGGGIYGDTSKMYISGNSNERIALNGNWKYNIGLDFKDDPAPVLNDGPNRPTVLFNAMINPFLQYSVRGVIWYQGEANVIKAHQYRQLFPAMIKDWRQSFKNADMPFYFVQLANFLKTNDTPGPSSWAELRDAQLQTLVLPNTGMAVAIDIGDAGDVHPKNKQEVGRRLALIALKQNYKVNTPFSGPLYRSCKIKGNNIIIKFHHVANGLKTGNGEVLKGFEIAGDDQVFHYATAVISDNTIIVNSTTVAKPVAVRYAWANNPICNLYNTAMLPASPFRTDDWQDSTL